ncbi:MAG: FAD:protein FMN transferase [Pyramidobacter sp.]|nr:FAD:protein FMN transferase [Pyramidobacter sp.]
MKKVLSFAAVALLALGGWYGWNQFAKTRKHSVSFYAMDTPVTLTAYGSRAEEALDRARSRIKQIESELSVTDPRSDVGRLNAAGGAPVEVGEDTAALTAFALRVNALTDGAFDPTLYPALRAWGFTTEERRVPEAAELAELLKLAGAERVHLFGRTLRLDEGSMLDLGAVGKGFAGDEALAAMAAAGVESALVNLGGNVQTLGLRPDGQRWRIGIKSPDGGLIGVLRVEAEAVVTSGGYERFFTGPDGRIYWHILDPRTGAPARSGVISATAVGPEGKVCDAMSTAFFVMGAEKTAAFWKEHGSPGFVLLTENGELWISEDLAARFEADPAYAGAKVTVVRR